jgi:acyl carrier protein
MDKFLNLVADILNREENSISYQDDFREYNEWDSLAALSFLAMLNEEYEVIISRRDFDNMITLEQIYQYIENQRGK